MISIQKKANVVSESLSSDDQSNSKSINMNVMPKKKIKNKIN